MATSTSDQLTGKYAVEWTAALGEAIREMRPCCLFKHPLFPGWGFEFFSDLRQKQRAIILPRDHS